MAGSLTTLKLQAPVEQEELSEGTDPVRAPAMGELILSLNVLRRRIQG